MVWTTTPWTIPANVAAAVNTKEEYLSYDFGKGKVWVMVKALTGLTGQGILPKNQTGFQTKLGSKLVGWGYEGPFDGLPRVKKSLGDFKHKVVGGDEQILPVSSEEGTGLVHIAPGAGTEDFQLGKKLGLPVIEVIDEGANYLEDLGEFSLQNAKNNPEIIIKYLQKKDGGKFLLKTQKYTHRYPACWRCKTELVWRVVDEWYIAMDKPSKSKVKNQKFKLKTEKNTEEGDGRIYREQIKDVAKKINWRPKWALDRELDWLNNMHDWLISKKRFWGLSLPIWECKKCGNFEVVGGKDELKDRAVEGWDKFAGHSPHRPWIDQVKLKCSKCNQVISRIPDVGNPWLDAGIVPFSTMSEDWFPADFITEGFPGQFKNWFYALLTMSTALKQTNPFENILGFANLVDEQGKPMHKSSGNSIEFNEAADKAGVDVMRWLYVTANPEIDLKFGYNVTDEIRRRFYLIFWNCYKFFVDRANVDSWTCELERGEMTALDKWVLARLTEVVLTVNKSLERYDGATASRAIEEFVVNDLSTWYIRRVRDRVGPSADKKDKNLVLGVLYGNLVTLSKLLAPFMPFISEEIYQNLTGDLSVHLTEYPLGDKNLLDKQLIADMKVVRAIVEKGHATRKDSGIKLRQPLAGLVYQTDTQLSKQLEQIIAEELNIKKVEYKKSSTARIAIKLDTKITLNLREEGQARDLIRQIQQMRKEMGLTLLDYIEIEAPDWPKKYENMILKSTVAVKISKADTAGIKKLAK
ncbi:class I tRNA ligase family protein [Candidatus Daviesbacteria bacterium]|nr:class I tRNA ligase family protein [Candidatus Daviesbacteria bacterium]